MRSLPSPTPSSHHILNQDYILIISLVPQINFPLSYEGPELGGQRKSFPPSCPFRGDRNLQPSTAGVGGVFTRSPRECWEQQPPTRRDSWVTHPCCGASKARRAGIVMEMGWPGWLLLPGGLLLLCFRPTAWKGPQGVCTRWQWPQQTRWVSITFSWSFSGASRSLAWQREQLLLPLIKGGNRCWHVGNLVIPLRNAGVGIRTGSPSDSSAFLPHYLRQ